MNLALLLHIYQPPVQEDRIVKEISASSYVPLIKLIKNNSDLRLSLNMPLSLMYQLHSTGEKELLADIRELFETEKIELTSTGAYHPLLTKIPTDLAEKEIVLNEYGIGYYFGKDKGFEGEEALLLKNVTGFFPPEMSINNDVLRMLDDLGYKWVAVDEASIPNQYEGPEFGPVYSVHDLDIKVVARDRNLSNLISFKRNSNIEDVVDAILMMRQEGKDAVIAMDGEFFGHHHKEGIDLLEMLIGRLTELEIGFATVSEVVNQEVQPTELDAIIESSWGATDAQVEAGNPYPLWDVADNKAQRILWEVLNKVAKSVKADVGMPADVDSATFETFPIWDLDELNKLSDVHFKNEVYKSVLLLQSLGSDQFWWASNVAVGDTPMYDPKFIDKAFDLYLKVATISEDEALVEFIQKKHQKMKELLA